jgi:lipoprotein-anchoring transpeptidase ErfK/SrfK
MMLARLVSAREVQDMCLFSSPRRFSGLVIIPLLAVMLTSPATAQTSSASEAQSTGTASARIQTKPTRAPTTANPANRKTHFNTVAPITKMNSGSARNEPNSDGTQVESTPGAKKLGSAILINIDKTNQRMTVFLDGVETYDWPVSTGKAGYSTPSGTYTATSMNEVWYSKQWDNSPMPHSIFFMKDGHAIHGSYEVKNLGKPVSHGCVRISPENATTLYSLVQKNGLQNTQVALTGVTPGGEYKVASRVSSAPRYVQARPGWFGFGDNYYTQPQYRSGGFGAWFGGSQGYYRPPAYYQPPRGY